MNHDMFCNRFKDSLNKNFEKPSLIIIDNTPYYFKILDKTPIMFSRKAVMSQWLWNHNVSFKDDMKKSKLLELISLQEQRFSL